MRWPRRIRQAVRHPKPYTPPIHNYSLMLPTDPPQYAASGTTFTGWQMKRTKGGGELLHWRKDW